MEFSAFVGLATLVLLTPLSGSIAKLTQDVQKVRLEATDARVQTVTESKNFLNPTLLFVFIPLISSQCAAHGQDVWLGKKDGRRYCQEAGKRTDLNLEATTVGYRE